MQSETSKKLEALQIVEKMQQNYRFFSLQSTGQLQRIKLILEMGANEQSDPRKKALMQLCARQAQEMSIFKQSKLSITFRWSYIRDEAKQYTKIVMAIVVFIAGLPQFIQNSQENKSIEIGFFISFLVFLVIFIGVVFNNLFSHQNIEKQGLAQINMKEN